MPRDSPRRAGGSGWGEGRLGFSAEAAAPRDPGPDERQKTVQDGFILVVVDRLVHVIYTAKDTLCADGRDKTSVRHAVGMRTALCGFRQAVTVRPLLDTKG